jgi:hypothetical protein
MRSEANAQYATKSLSDGKSPDLPVRQMISFQDGFDVSESRLDVAATC